MAKKLAAPDASIAISPKLGPSLQRVYAAYRTSLLNAKYYGYKLKLATRANLFAEVVIALTGAGGVSGWAIWNTSGGHPVWVIIAGASAILATLKPIVPLTKNVSRYSQLYGGHYMDYLALKDLVDRIAIAKDFSRELEREFDHIAKRYRELASHDDPYPSEKLVERFQNEVNQQIPVESLWCPR
jgi:hypothetical protein